MVDKPHYYSCIGRVQGCQGGQDPSFASRLPFCTNSLWQITLLSYFKAVSYPPPPFKAINVINYY